MNIDRRYYILYTEKKLLKPQQFITENVVEVKVINPYFFHKPMWRSVIFFPRVQTFNHLLVNTLNNTSKVFFIHSLSKSLLTLMQQFLTSCMLVKHPSLFSILQTVIMEVKWHFPPRAPPTSWPAHFQLTLLHLVITVNAHKHIMQRDQNNIILLLFNRSIIIRGSLILQKPSQ